FTPRDVEALRVARKEPIGRAAEALPDGVRSRLLDRADRLPLALEPPDLCGRGIPVRRLGARFDSRAQCLFFRQIRGPHGLSLGEILVAPREEPIARRAEALPDCF